MADEPIRILRLIARLNVGGPARHVVWLTKHMNSGPWRTTLMAGRVESNETDMSYFAETNGVTPRIIADLGRSISPKDALHVLRMWRLMLRERPHIVHTHTAKAGFIGRVAGILYRLTPPFRRPRFVHTFHGHTFRGYWNPLFSAVFLFIEKFLARVNTDAIVTISRGQQEEINRAFGVGRRKQFHVIPLGMDFSELEPDPNAPPADWFGEPKPMTIACVGRLTAVKNIELFLSAASRLVYNGRARGAGFLVVGDGEQRPWLEDRAKELGLRKHIRFTGVVRDMGLLYNSVDILTITSHNEGTPLSLIEGMSRGVPFVATAVGGVPDLAGDLVEICKAFKIYEYGILVRPNESHAFADALGHLVENPDLRARLGVAGREFVHGKYSVRRLVSDMGGLYTKLLNPKS